MKYTPISEGKCEGIDSRISPEPIDGFNQSMLTAAIGPSSCRNLLIDFLIKKFCPSSFQGPKTRNI